MTEWPLWPTRPMLAKVRQDPFSHPDWLFEVKWDGVRCLLHISGERVRLQARSLRDVTMTYPELAGAAEFFDAGEAVVDGEIVSLDPEGRSSFSMLSNRMHLQSRSEIAAAASTMPVTFYAFDLLYHDGLNVMRKDLESRKLLLDEIMTQTDQVKYSGHVEEEGLAFFAAARERELEGIMAKRRDGPYEPGARSGSWLKIRINLRDEFVIGGWTRGSGGRRATFGALLLGQYVDGRLHYVGKAGTGFSRGALRNIRSRLEAIESERNPFAEDPGERDSSWVRPELVCEVKFAERTEEGLRFPVFLGMRDGRKPSDARIPEELRPTDQGKPVYGRVELSNPDKLFWPGIPLAKRDLFNYYMLIANRILPHLRDRPLTLLRQPDGIEGKKFYQRNRPDFTPDWIETSTITRGGHTPIVTIMCQDEETLAWLVNLGCVELNPWTSRADAPDRPDFIIFDLDPVHPAIYEDSCTIALAIRNLLDEVGFRSYVKTSGKRGLHIYIPIRRELTFEQARSFSRELGSHLAPDFPEKFTMSRRASDKRGKVFFDPAQQGWGKSLASAYSLRPTPGATVSTPITWKEAAGCISPGSFDIHSVPKRLRTKGDPWGRLLGDFQPVEAVLGE